MPSLLFLGSYPLTPFTLVPCLKWSRRRQQTAAQTPSLNPPPWTPPPAHSVLLMLSAPRMLSPVMLWPRRSSHSQVIMTVRSCVFQFNFHQFYYKFSRQFCCKRWHDSSKTNSPYISCLLLTFGHLVSKSAWMNVMLILNNDIITQHPVISFNKTNSNLPAYWFLRPQNSSICFYSRLYTNTSEQDRPISIVL